MLHVGSMYYQDLWSYSSTNLWTQLFPTNGQPQPVGRKYHSGGAIYSSTNISTILFFYGGMDSNNMVLNTWLAVDLGDNCAYYCNIGNPPTCRSFASCVATYTCDWTLPNKFQCNTTCQLQPTGCPPVTSCTEQYLCWDGECQSSVNLCKPLPYCDIGKKRCADGSCSTESDTLCLKSPACGSSLTLCADGTCQATCPYHFGCLPDDNPVMCGDGSCNMTFAACNAGCNQTQTQCFEGCSVSPCTLPDFVMPVEAQDPVQWVLSPGISKSENINFVLGGSKNTNIRGLIQAIGMQSTCCPLVQLVSGVFELWGLQLLHVVFCE